MTRWALLLVLVLTTTAACAPGGGTTATAPPASDIAVGLTDFAIATSTTQLIDGLVQMRVTNAGATAHDLRIAGGATTVQAPTLTPGGTVHVDVDTAGARRLVAWCTLAGHRQQGMETTFAVSP